MKEMITLRLYEQPHQPATCDAEHYCPAEDVRGWDYARGDQIGLQERDGGYLMAGIDHIDPAIHEDGTGRYRVAVAWTLD